MIHELIGNFHDIVLASLNEYIDARKIPKAGKGIQLRPALAAASNLYHFREILQKEEAMYTRKFIATLCDDFNLLGDVVNVNKHGKLTQRENPLIGEPAQIQEALVISTFTDEQGKYNHAEGRILVVLDQKTFTERDLLEVMINVANMWIRLLIDLGKISQERYPYYIYSADRLRLRNECFPSERFEVVATQGIEYSFTVRAQFYDYGTNKMAPATEIRIG